LDTDEPVLLVGYIFEKEKCPLAWKEACKRLQFGGERGYGWGDLEQIEAREYVGENLFNGKAKFSGIREQPIISLSDSKLLLAHASTANIPASGGVEPLVGREWRSYNSRAHYAGQYIEFSGLCFSPGSIVDVPLDFVIGEFGIWRYVMPVKA
jgi:hypothetical protein